MVLRDFKDETRNIRKKQGDFSPKTEEIEEVLNIKIGLKNSMHKLNHRLDTINKLRYRSEKINQNADSRRKKKNKEMEYRTGKVKEG